MTPRNQDFLELPLPSSAESEAGILGSIFIMDGAINIAAEGLEAEDFYTPHHRKVFNAMLELYRKGSTVDPFAVSEVLKRDAPHDPLNAMGAIADLSHGIPLHLNLEQLAKTVQQKARLRDLIRTCNSIIAESFAEADDPETTLLNAQNRINNLCLKAVTSTESEGFVSLADIVKNDVLAGLDDLLHKRTNKIGTGFPVIDKAIGGGISLSDVMLLCGLPSSGKSALALQIAFNIANQHIPVAFLAGEMTNRENVFRLLSQVSKMQNVNSLTHLSIEDHNVLAEWADAIKNVPLHFDHRTSDLQTLAARLRTLVREKGIKVLVIDYIQLLKMEKVDKRKRFERITEASQEVKRLANELDIAIISVAQFNREGAKSGAPSMHDLESSGQLEKDASLILIVDRVEDSTDVNIRVVKGRNSGINTFPGKFFGRTVSFEF